MTSRERINNTIDRKPVDRVPYSFDLTGIVADGLRNHYRLAPDVNLHAHIGDDLLYVGSSLFDAAGDNPLLQTDEFGTLWDRSGMNRQIGDWGTILSHPLKEASLQGYAFPDGANPARFAGFDVGAFRAQGRFVILGVIGLFDIGWQLRGFEDFMMDMAGDETFAEELLDKALEFNLKLLSCAPDGIDGVRFGEDWGLQKGMIMGAQLWRKYLKPRLRIMYEAARKKGLRVFIHTCGDIAEIFPDLIEIGVEAVNPVQPEAMDIAFLRREYGRDITMYGGLGSQSTLVYGSPADVVAEAKSRLALFDNGGYIIGPAGAIPTDAPLENVIALVDFLRGL